LPFICELGIAVTVLVSVVPGKTWFRKTAFLLAKSLLARPPREATILPMVKLQKSGCLIATGFSGADSSPNGALAAHAQGRENPQLAAAYGFGPAVPFHSKKVRRYCPFTDSTRYRARFVV
jgi:hypothetical protein